MYTWMGMNILPGVSIIISVSSSRAVASHPHTSASTVKMSPPWTSQSSLQGVPSNLHGGTPLYSTGPFQLLGVQGWGAFWCWGNTGKAAYGMRDGVNHGQSLWGCLSAMGGREGKGWFINKGIFRNGKWVCIINDCKICLNMERKVATSQDGMEPGPQSLCPNTVELLLWFWETQNTPLGQRVWGVNESTQLSREMVTKN